MGFRRTRNRVRVDPWTFDLSTAGKSTAGKSTMGRSAGGTAGSGSRAVPRRRRPAPAGRCRRPGQLGAGTARRRAARSGRAAARPVPAPGGSPAAPPGVTGVRGAQLVPGYEAVVALATAARALDRLVSAPPDPADHGHQRTGTRGSSPASIPSSWPPRGTPAGRSSEPDPDAVVVDDGAGQPDEV